MSWEVLLTERLAQWLEQQNETTKADVFKSIMVLQDKGPQLGRPYADTVNGSDYKNMKELRVQSGGDPIRILYAFDPQRKAVLLCAGNKTRNDKRFYKEMIPIADQEFREHLAKK